MLTEDQYKEKYLKYKAKYLDLKAGGKEGCWEIQKQVLAKWNI